jgi:hypothetical protein
MERAPGFLHVLFVAVALGACGDAVRAPEAPPAAPPPVPAPCPTAAALAGATPSQPPFPVLSWIPAAETVRIERGWGGLLGSWVAHYDLRRRGDAFAGLAMLTTTKPGRPSRTDPRPPPELRSGARPITVPLTAMTEFLEVLAAAGPLQPAAPGRVLIHASDDFPWWIIDVEAKPECPSPRRCAAARGVRFSSSSTGDRPAPWFLWTGEHPLDLDSAAPALACGKLEPHLGDQALHAALR